MSQKVSLYTLKIQTNLGEVVVENVLEFVFGKRFLYYSTEDDKVGRISRSSIQKSYRQLENRAEWSEITPPMYASQSRKKKKG